MKRLAAFAALLLLLPILSCSAATGDFTCEYTPRTANSTVFYIDVCSARKVTGAVFELSFDDSMVSYYTASPVNSTATVRDRPQNGTVTAAFADSAAVSGKICRFSFKALQSGTVRFVLRLVEGADERKKAFTDADSYSLEVKLGKDDVVSSAASRSGRASASSSSSSSSSSSKRGGGKSYLSTAPDEETPQQPGMTDVRSNSPLKWILIGAGIPLLVAALVLTGVIIGRKSKAPGKTKEPGEENPEPDENKDNDA